MKIYNLTNQKIYTIQTKIDEKLKLMMISLNNYLKIKQFIFF